MSDVGVICCKMVSHLAQTGVKCEMCLDFIFDFFTIPYEGEVLIFKYWTDLSRVI